ncbi:MAG: integrase [Erythrobacter sp.]|nr:integrase [Erythrobacter sp.]
MTSKPVGLTDAKIRSLTPPDTGQLEWADHIIPGLRVRVGRSGSKTFILRKRVGERWRNITIGPFKEYFGLADARKKARSILLDIENGRGAPRPAKEDGTTLTGRLMFTFLWNQYLERAVRGHKRSASEIERIGNKFLLPRFGDRMADSITRAEITTLVEDVTYRNPQQPTLREGRSVHQRLSAFYSWAMPKLERLQANPCQYAWRPPLGKPRDRFLTEDEIRLFWNACDKMDWPFGPGFKLLLVTGQRRSEVFGAARSEFKDGIWTIPGDRAKNGLAHIVPLSQLALKVIDALPVVSGSDRLFAVPDNLDAVSSGFSKGSPRLLRIMTEFNDDKPVEHFVLHDLRRTAATGMQRLGVAMPVTEAVLNHISGSRGGIAGVYQRHDYFEEKKEALAKWADEIERVVTCAGS